MRKNILTLLSLSRHQQTCTFTLARSSAPFLRSCPVHTFPFATHAITRSLFRYSCAVHDFFPPRYPRTCTFPCPFLCSCAVHAALSYTIHALVRSHALFFVRVLYGFFFLSFLSLLAALHVMPLFSAHSLYVLNFISLPMPWYVPIPFLFVMHSA